MEENKGHKLKYLIITSGGEFPEFLKEELNEKYPNIKFDFDKVDLRITLKNSSEEIVGSYKESELEEILDDKVKTKSLIEKLGVVVDDSFYELSPREKYGELLIKLGPGKETTASPNPQDFINIIRDKIGNYDKLIISTLSSKLSGTYKSAVMAVQELDQVLDPLLMNRIVLLDTNLINYLVGIYTYKVLERLINAGNDNNVVQDKVVDNEVRESVLNEMFFEALLYDLRYIDIGGRFNIEEQSLLGNLAKKGVEFLTKLGVNLLVTLKDGNAKPTGLNSLKRGRNRALKVFLDNFEEWVESKQGSGDYNILFLYSRRKWKGIDEGEIKEQVKEVLGNNTKFNFYSFPLDLVLATHLGSAIGIIAYKTN